jgi:hypothetical protein
LISSDERNSQEILNRFLNAPADEPFKIFHLLFKKEYLIDSEEGVQRYTNFKNNPIILKIKKSENP